MSLEVCRTVKNILSGSFLIPNAPTSVFGVGVGIERNCDFPNEKVLGAKYHVRVYTDAPSDNRILPNIFKELVFSAQEKFPLRGRFENTDIEIRCIKAPKPRFAVTLNENHKYGCKINGDGRLMQSPNGLLNQQIFAGIEIRLGLMGKSGTLGYFARKNNKYYALSNSHVIASFGNAISLDVYYLSYKIATLEKLPQSSIKFGNIITVGNKQKYFPYKLDAAIALLDPKLQPQKEIINRGKLPISGTFPDEKNGRTDPEKSFRVTKHGYLTCETGGWIDDVDCDFLMDDTTTTDEKYKAKFVNQFRVVRTTEPNKPVDNQNSSFAGAGDSGSLVFDNKKISPSKSIHRAIGLLFAVGAEGAFENISRIAEKNNNNYAVITPISVIKKELGINLICDPQNQSV